MNKTFTEEFKLDKKKFEKTKAFDIILNVDTQYFIDPAKIRNCKVKEFSNAKKLINDFFQKIIALVKVSKIENDRCWQAADKLLTFREIKGTCLGYSGNGISGNAIGPKLRLLILRTLKEIINSGTENPLIFELLVLFQEKIASDRLSDLITFILKNNIIAYTERISKELNIKTKECTINHIKRNLPFNKYNNNYILLLPASALSPLPVAFDFSDIDYVCYENQRVKDSVNSIVRDLLIDDYKNIGKQQYKYIFKNNKEFSRLLLKKYEEVVPKEYDFYNDPSGEFRWLQDSRNFASEAPIKFSDNELKDNYLLVNKICEKFKMQIETNKMNELLFVDGKPRKETYAQLLFFGISDVYCELNNLSLNKETNNGRGPVDFKFSKGYKSILVEVKLTSNKKLISGITTQLPIYMEQERCDNAIYLIIDTGYPNMLKTFKEFYNKWTPEQKNKIKVIYVDARPKKSASVA